MMRNASRMYSSCHVNCEVGIWRESQPLVNDRLGPYTVLAVEEDFCETKWFLHDSDVSALTGRLMAYCIEHGIDFSVPAASQPISPDLICGNPVL